MSKQDRPGSSKSKVPPILTRPADELEENRQKLLDDLQSVKSLLDDDVPVLTPEPPVLDQPVASTPTRSTSAGKVPPLITQAAPDSPATAPRVPPVLDTPAHSPQNAYKKVPPLVTTPAETDTSAATEPPTLTRPTGQPEPPILEPQQDATTSARGERQPRTEEQTDMFADVPPVNADDMAQENKPGSAPASENPFLPQTIRDRLEQAHAERAADLAASTPSLPENLPEGISEAEILELIDAIVTEQLPILEQKLRLQLMQLFNDRTRSRQ